jgi:hypothetical protein
VYSQCNIVGKDSFSINDTETYTIENDNAQCSECHLWAVIGRNAQIDGDFRKNSVKIKPIAIGRTVLSLSVLSSEGFSQCSKNIDISADNASSTNSASNYNSVNCDITTTDFKEVKYGQGTVSFFPIPPNNDYKYTWTAIYFGGTQQESSEKVPLFPYNTDGGISTLKVKIMSSKCIRSMTRNYDPTYWENFSNQQ